MRNRFLYPTIASAGLAVMIFALTTGRTGDLDSLTSLVAVRKPPSSRRQRVVRRGVRRERGRQADSRVSGLPGRGIPTKRQANRPASFRGIPAVN